MYLAKNKKTGQQVAVKAIQKLKVKDYESFVNEMAILRELDHPNIIKLYETWETERICFLVTEYCAGGELFYHIVKKEKRHLGESEAAAIMRQAFSALKYLHMNNIAHRDIKPENFLLFKEDDLDNIKLIDFGLSKKLSDDEIMHNPNGTAYYIAPEVLNGEYDYKCDIWSMGVVLYILLCGRPPFKGKSNPEIIKNVLKGEYHFDYESFSSVSDEVKAFIGSCLEKDTTRRFSAEEAFADAWIQKQWDADLAKIEIPGEVPGAIQNFMNSVNFKRTTITFMASRIPEEEIENLKKAFIKMDADGNGVLSKEELVEGVESVPECAIRPEDWDVIFKLMDTDNSGSIDYTEFIASCMQSYLYLNESNLQNAFQFFDKDGNGTITMSELKETLGKDNPMLTEADLNEIIKEVDSNDDGEIDYKEFLRMMKGDTVARHISQLLLE